MLYEIKKELRSLGTVKKAAASAWFFKTGPGQYGEGDVFIGITVPEQRKVAKKYSQITLTQVVQLLRSKEHEFRLTALLILGDKFEKGNDLQKKEIFDLYLENTKWINNWDLVDSSAPRIIGGYTFNRSRAVLLKLARSKSLWERRIAIISTLAHIMKGDPSDALKISGILLHDDRDLIHKAVGWMLREIGKRCSLKKEKDFLDKYASRMPRTMLRYAIERFPENERKKYLNK